MTGQLTAEQLDDADFEVVLRRASRDHRRRAIERLGRDPVSWLAVAPSWTLSLARAADFPADVEAFVAAAGKARLCVTSASRPRSKAAPLRVLAALGAYCPRAFVPRAVALLDEADDRTAAVAIADLAPAFDPEQALAAALRARTIKNAADGGIALAALWAAAGETLPEWVRFNALVAAEEAPSAGLLARLAEAAPERGLELVGRVDLPEDRELVLARLAPVLPAEQLEAYLDAVLALPDNAARVELGLAVLERTPRRRVGSVFGRAVEWAAGIADAAGRSTARLALAEALARAGMDGEEQARRIEDLDVRALAYAKVAAFASPYDAVERLVQTGLQALDGTTRPARRVEVMAALAGPLSDAHLRKFERLCREAWQLAQEHPATAEWFQPLLKLAAVAPQLGAAERAYDIARRLGGPRERCEPLLLVARRLPEPMRERAIDEAVTALRAIPEPLDRSPLLALLARDAPDVAPALVEETLALLAHDAADLSFRMPDPTRVEVLDALREGDSLARTAQRVGGAIASAQASGVAVPPPVTRWATLARAPEIELAFTVEYSRALKVGDVATALDWIDTGAALAATLADPALDGAVRYARRRMELVHRLEQESRSPEQFLERSDQLAAFDALHVGDAWALHYVGPGGVGKSTLLRRLARRKDLITAKVDFDYLSPDYPVRQPALLLLELMAELELHARDPQAESLVQSFREAAIKLHEEASETPSEDPLAQLDAPQFASALRAFCGFVSVLDRPVVLFLDTCEELARFQPQGAPARNVIAAFGAIERIHAAAPNVRFVLSGRRLLATSGDGWEADGGPATALAPRPYLRLHRIDGFDAGEARAFLGDVKKLRIGDELMAAVLGRSPQTRTAERLVGDAERDQPRYNPFDLALYAEWITQEPDLDAAAIATAADPYIDLRIVGRISPDKLRGLRELLPAAALLGRFDHALLRPAFTGSAAEYEALWAELGSQEWIGHAEDELVVDATLRARLLDYYRAGAAYEDARRVLAGGVAARLEGARLGDLTPEHVEAAMQILPDPAGAWHRLVMRICESGRWDWAEHVTGRLLADEGMLAERTHPARAAATATLASALLHRREDAQLEPYWLEVRNTAQFDPDRAAGAWLGARARIATDPGLQLLDVIASFPSELEGDLQRHRWEQLAVACCTALDSGVVDPEPDPESIRFWAERVRGLDLTPTARAAVELATAPWRPDAEAVEALTRAARGLEPSGQHWLDWVAPSSTVDRLRLVALRLGADPEPRWESEAGQRLASIDAERLLSALLDRELAARVPGVMRVADFEKERYDPLRRPVAAVHREVRPLFCTVALVHLAHGNAGAALGVLDARLEQAQRSGIDPETVRVAELHKLKVLRRMRMADDALVDRLARYGKGEERDSAQAVIALTRAPAEQPPEDVPWRYRDALSSARRAALLAWGDRQWRSGEPADGVDLDRVENSVMRGDSSVSRQVVVDEAVPTSKPEPLVRLLVRGAALGIAARESVEMVGLPHRRLGEIALEEGELLALRLPDRALLPLQLAVDAFERAEDPVGALQARVLHTIALAHAGEPAGVRGQLELRTAAGKVRGRRALPDEPSLDALLEDPFDLPGPAPWAGWQMRLGVALRHCAGRPPARTGSLPLELDAEPRGEAARLGRRTSLKTIAITAASVALLAFFLFAIVWGTQKVLGLLGADVSLWVAAAIVGGVAVAAGLLKRGVDSVGRDVGSSAASRTALRLTITGPPGPEGVPWPAGSDVAVRLRRQQPAALSSKSPWRLTLDLYAEILPSVLTGKLPALWRLGAPVETGARWATPPLGAYDKAADGFPKPIAESVTEVLTAARKASVPLALDVEPHLAGLPWEAITARATPVGKMRPFRLAAGHPLEELPQRVTVLSARQWRGLADLAWTGWAREAELVGAPVPVVHAIGRPVAGTRERLLQVGGEYASGGVKGRESGRSWRPSELARGRLVILQAEPTTTGAKQRVDSEREAAALLRMLGADVFAEGATAVLVVPSLEAGLVGEVVARIAKSLEPPGRFAVYRKLVGVFARRMKLHSDHELGRLLRLTAELRELTPGEEADDICLFARTNLPQYF